MLSFRTQSRRSFLATPRSPVGLGEGTSKKQNSRIARAVSSVIEPLENRTLMSTVVVNSISDSATGAGVVTLRDAIATANSSTTPTTITFDPTAFATAQTIVLGGTQLELSNTAEPTTITGPAAGVTVSGNALSRIFQIDSGVSLSLASVSVTDGMALGTSQTPTSSGLGGGIDVIGGRLTMSDGSVSGNTGTYGGGIGDDSGSVTLTGVTLSNNNADLGGAIDSGAFTGGYNTSGSLVTLNDSTVSDNTASAGGGLAVYRGAEVLINSTIADNTETTSGLSNVYAGGGLLIADGPAIIDNSTIAGNTAEGSSGGGGIVEFTAEVQIANSIVASNTATAGAGPDVSGAVSSSGYNLIGKTDGSSGWVGTDLTGTTASPLSAGLGALGNSGGSTETFSPLAGSDAIGHGSVSLIPSGVTTDQRGYARTFNGTVDIGAVEEESTPATTASSLVVNTTSDTATGAGVVTLRDAIATANAATTPSTITFDPTVFATAQTITLDGTQLELSNTAEPTTITGPSAGVTISGNNESRVLLIDSGVNVTASGLTITDGNTTSLAGNYIAAKGAGISVQGGSLTLADSSVVGNESSTYAGGIAASNSANLTLNDVTVSGNSGYGTGGIDLNSCTATFSNSTISGNTNLYPSGSAFGTGGGGGLEVFLNATATLDNVTVAQNTCDDASSGGGGISVGSGASIVMADVTVAGNTTAGVGGGIANFDAGSISLANTIVAGDTATSGPDVSGAVTSQGYNLIGATDASTGWTSTDLTGTAASPLSVGLGALAANGGTTETLLPLAGSYAIGHGSVSLIPSGVTTDQRGDPRTLSGAVDIGAVEVGGTPTAAMFAATTTFTASAHTIETDATDTFTITVASASGAGPVPTGTVSIYEGTAFKGTYDLNSNGQAVEVFQAYNPAVNTPYSAVYSGDAHYTSSTSNTITQTYLPLSQLSTSIKKAVIPVSNVAGQPLNARVPVSFTNTGSLLTGTYTITLYADTSTGGLSGNQVALQTISRRTSLRTNRVLPETFAVKKLAATFTPGTYYLIVEVTDPLGNDNLINTSQTIAVAAPFVSLAPSAVVVKPATVAANRYGTVTMTVANNGNIAATGFMYITLELSSDGVTASSSFPSMTTKVRINIPAHKAAKESVRFKVPTALAAGTYYPLITVSADGSTASAVGSPFTAG